MPALVGRGQAMLELDRDADALASFEAALAKDPSLTDLRSRVDVLRFRATQDMLARAKAAADARRWDEAAATYRAGDRRVARFGVPVSRSGRGRAAGRPVRRARSSTIARPSSSTPSDARSHAGIGAILESQGDVRRRAGRLRAGARRSIRPKCPTPRSRALRAAAALAQAAGRVSRHSRRRRGHARATSRRCSASGSKPLLARAQPRQVDHHRHPRPLGAAVDHAGRARGRHGHAAQLRVRAGAAACGAASWRRRCRALLTLIAVGEARAGEEVAGGARRRSTTCAPTHLSYPAVSAAVAVGRHAARRAATSSCCGRVQRRRGASTSSAASRRCAPAMTRARSSRIANQLTLLRMLLIPAFVLLTLYGEFGWALAIFVVRRR